MISPFKSATFPLLASAPAKVRLSRFFTSALCCAGLLASVGTTAHAVDVSVNWGSTVGTAGNFAYGLNVYEGFNPSVAGEGGNSNYKNNVASMKPGIIRYHRAGSAGQMSESTTSNGWVKNANSSTAEPSWDRDKIRRALRYSYTFYPQRMMNLVNWPAKWSDSSGKLKTDKYDDYAAFCADLVRAINVELGPSYAFDYWEVTNERDGLYNTPAEMEQLAEIYNQAANAMRAVRNSSGGYPTKSGQPIKVGGPAFANTYYTSGYYYNTLIDKFVEKTRTNLDFISYHAYASGSTQTESELFNRAATLGDAASRVQKSLDRWNVASLPKFHDEFNLYADAAAVPQSERDKQGNMVGAIFDAIALASIAKKGAVAVAWNEADGWYGKLKNDTAWSKRHGAYLFGLYNNHLRGSIKASTTADASKIYIYPVQSGTKRAFAIVNRSTASQSVRCTFSGWTSPGNFTAYQITSATPNPGSGSTVQLSSLTGSSGTYSVPAYSVTVLVNVQS